MATEIMTDDQLKERILAEAEDHNGQLRLSCKAAHDISDELDVSLGRIGKICNQEKIRIKNCMLGCF